MQHLLIREPHHRPAQRFQRHLSLAIPFDHVRQQVNRAIDLNDQFEAVTGEIGAVGADRVLAP